LLFSAFTFELHPTSRRDEIPKNRKDDNKIIFELVVVRVFIVLLFKLFPQFKKGPRFLQRSPVNLNTIFSLIRI